MLKLFKQAIRFVGVSGIGWLLDFTVYTLLGIWFPHPEINNMISSMIGVTFVFIFSTKKIFHHDGKLSLKWKYVIYVVYQLILIFLISKLLGLVNGWILQYVTWGLILRFSTIVAKIVVTPITMVVNFFVMKGLVEKL